MPDESLLILGGLAALGALSATKPPEEAQSLDAMAIYPSDQPGEWVFEASAPENTQVYWSLSPLDGNDIEFTGNRVTKTVNPGQYSIAVSTATDRHETDLIIGGG